MLKCAEVDIAAPRNLACELVVLKPKGVDHRPLPKARKIPCEFVVVEKHKCWNLFCCISQTANVRDARREGACSEVVVCSVCELACDFCVK